MEILTKYLNILKDKDPSVIGILKSNCTTKAIQHPGFFFNSKSSKIVTAFSKEKQQFPTSKSNSAALNMSPTVSPFRQKVIDSESDDDGSSSGSSRGEDTPLRLYNYIYYI